MSLTFSYLPLEISKYGEWKLDCVVMKSRDVIDFELSSVFDSIALGLRVCLILEDDKDFTGEDIF